MKISVFRRPSAYGVDEDKFFTLLPTMAKQADASGSPSNNPRVPSQDEMVQLYKKVWLEGAA